MTSQPVEWDGLKTRQFVNCVTSNTEYKYNSNLDEQIEISFGKWFTESAGSSENLKWQSWEESAGKHQGKQLQRELQNLRASKNENVITPAYHGDYVGHYQHEK